MVTIVGLLGCLALLPVASSVAKKGRQNDAAAVAATTCVSAFDSRSMRRPTLQFGQTGGWMGWNQSWDLRPSPPKPANGFHPVTSIQFPYGTAFCLDPRFIATNAATANAASVFPYGTGFGDPRMFRITLYGGLNDSSGNPLVLNQFQADSLFTIDDDLTYLRPDDRTIMPEQQYVGVPGAATPTLGKRQIDGHMSWMATLVPRLERYTTSFNETYVTIGRPTWLKVTCFTSDGLPFRASAA
jgi:hypothetical protein